MTTKTTTAITWGALPPARRKRMMDDSSIETLRNGISHLDYLGARSGTIRESTEALDRVETLLTDIQLDPDRNYSLLDIERLKIAVQRALYE